MGMLNVRRPAEVVTSFEPYVTIPPTRDGQVVKPIWANRELCPPGQYCTKYFFYDHFLPTGYKVTEAEIWLQGEDFAFMFLNAQTVASADPPTMATGNYSHVVLTPAQVQSVFPSGSQNIAVGIQVQNYWDYYIPPGYQDPAAFAAKVRFKACPR